MAFPLQEEVVADRLSICKVEKKTMAPAAANPLTSSCVPFKWEEAPGKPISNCNELIKGDSTAPPPPPPLQLPPKLQFQPHQYHYHHSSESFLWQKPPIRIQPKNQKFIKLCKCMFRNASWSQPLHPQRSFVRQAHDNTFDDDDQGHLVINDRFFYDKTSLHQACNSIDSWQPILPLYEEKEDDQLVCRVHPSLALDDTESTASSPWQPIMFHKREGSASSPWQPIMFHEREEDDDGLHFYNTASTEKPSQTDPFANDFEHPSTSPWCLGFGPDEEDDHNKGGSKKITRAVALIRFKSIISKVCKIKRKREANQADMWSPTLATYLYNQQKQKEEDSIRSPCLSEDEQEDEHPRSIRGQLSLVRSPYFSEEEQHEPHKLTHKLSLSNSDQLSHNGPFISDDNGSFREQVGSTSAGDPSIDTKERVPACKGICKLRKTVRILAATIKLILVQTEARGRRAGYRCKPKFNTSSSSSRLGPTH